MEIEKNHTKEQGVNEKDSEHDMDKAPEGLPLENRNVLVVLRVPGNNCVLRLTYREAADFGYSRVRTHLVDQRAVSEVDDTDKPSGASDDSLVVICDHASCLAVGVV